MMNRKTQTIWTDAKGKRFATLLPDGTVEFESNLYGGQSVEKLKELHQAIGDILTDLASTKHLETTGA